MSFVGEQIPYLYVEVAHYDSLGVIIGLRVRDNTVKAVLNLLSITHQDCKVGVNGKEVDLLYKLYLFYLL